MSRDLDAATVALAGIGGFSAPERDAIVALVKIGHVLVGPGGEGWAPPVTSLVERGFTWSEFDRWHAFFTARGVFPPRWEGLHMIPTADESAAVHVLYRLRKLELLLDWLDMLGRRAADLRHYTRQGRRIRIARQDDGHRCPVCESYNAREVTPGTDVMPPLHPGCRCVLMAAASPPPRERTAGLQRRPGRSASGDRV